MNDVNRLRILQNVIDRRLEASIAYKPAAMARFIMYHTFSRLII